MESIDAKSQLKPAAQYLRMSTDNQRYSLENQANIIDAYCARLGYTIVASYVDAGKSGVTTARRDGLKQLLRDVLAGGNEYATILVVDVSRWGRFQDPDEGAHYEFLCRQAGVKVRYCAESFEDDNSSTAAIVKSLKRVMAADYSRQLSDRCRAGLRRQALKGFTQGGPAPYGVRRQAYNQDGSPGSLLAVGEQRPRLDQTVRWVKGSADEQRTMRNIFALFLDAEMGLAEIGHFLNARKQPYHRGERWNFSRVRSVLTNEVAIGYFAFNKQLGEFPHEPTAAPRGEWLRVKIFPGFISMNRFRAAQEKFLERGGNSYSDDEMIRRLGKLLARRGTLSQPIINSCPITPCARAYGHRFGSLEAAYERLGFVSPRRRGFRLDDQSYTQTSVVATLKALFEQRGYLTAPMIDAHAVMPTAAYVAKLFGNLENAYIAAGFTLSFRERQVAGWARTRAARLAFKASLDAPNRPAPSDSDPEPLVCALE